MFMTRIPIVFALMLALTTTANAQTAITNEQAKALAIDTAKPEYPYWSRSRHHVGRGLFILHVRPDGTVRSVEVAKSTGYAELDDSGIAAFRRWRFRPNTVTKVKIPLTFTMQGVARNTVSPGKGVNAPRPEYPLEARQQHLTGSGIVLMRVDTKTGRVISAEMEKSTGHKILDEAALRAFRLWHFKPGTDSVVRIPINYTMDPREEYRITHSQ